MNLSARSPACFSCRCLPMIDGPLPPPLTHKLAIEIIVWIIQTFSFGRECQKCTAAAASSSTLSIASAVPHNQADSFILFWLSNYFVMSNCAMVLTSRAELSLHWRRRSRGQPECLVVELAAICLLRLVSSRPVSLRLTLPIQDTLS